MKKFMTRLGAGALAVAAVLSVVAGAGSATLVGRSGTTTATQILRTENNAWSTSSTGWVTIPGMVWSLTLPSTRRIEVDYGSESRCYGATGYGTVRVVLVRPTGALQELDPIAGTDFAYDTCTPASDGWEAHAIKRGTPWLTASNYQIWVQARVTTATAALRLDEQWLRVATINP